MDGVRFELIQLAEANAVSLVGDDSASGAEQAYAACRSASGVERRVRLAGAKAARWAPETTAPKRAERPARGESRLVWCGGVARPRRAPTVKHNQAPLPKRGAEQRACPKAAVRRKRR